MTTYEFDYEYDFLEIFRFDYEYEFDYEYDFLETFRFDYEYEFDYEYDFLPLQCWWPAANVVTDCFSSNQESV